jgi:hypothetical protein
MATRKSTPLPQRFRAKVEQGPGCWLWRGARTLGGYGQIIQAGRRLYTHRVAYELAPGPIPPGLLVCHRCDNPPCVNPAHLFLGTHAENMGDSSRKGRMRPGSQSPRAKVTEAQVAELRRIRPRGRLIHEHAGRLGISPWTVYSILNGRFWRHVGAPHDRPGDMEPERPVVEAG